MKRFTYKILLETLKILVRIKRMMSQSVFFIRKSFWWLDALVRNKIGYRLYIWQKKIRKSGRFITQFRDGRILELVGQRQLLQGVLIIMVGIIAVPQSQLYSKENGAVAGRDTILYELVGPGDQNFEIEEITASRTEYEEKEYRSWVTGAVVKNTPQPTGTDYFPNRSNNNVAISLGGGAIIKPTIAPGSVSIPASGSSESNSDNTPKERGTLEYTVQVGDVLGSIATKYDVSVETILWANDLTYNSVIRPGDTLVILPTSGIIHQVKSGDTLGKIARLYGAAIGDIIEENTLASAGTLQIGQKLVIPGGKRIAAAPAPVRPRVPNTTAVVETPTVPVAPPPPSVSGGGSSYIWPTSVRTITQYFGWQHTGVDIAGPIGSPLYAARAGRVITSQCGWNGGYGCYIILDHGDGVNTLYGHASKLYVSVGENVSQGQTIALMGSTGRSTGPHVHFEVRVGGKRLNPFNYVK